MYFWSFLSNVSLDICRRESVSRRSEKIFHTQNLKVKTNWNNETIVAHFVTYSYRIFKNEYASLEVMRWRVDEVGVVTEMRDCCHRHHGFVSCRWRGFIYFLKSQNDVWNQSCFICSFREGEDGRILNLNTYLN